MGRPIFAIVLGYLCFGLPAFALFRVTGVDPHLAPATGFLLFSIGGGIVFALLAGYVTAWIARRDVLWPVLSVAALIAMGAAASLAARPRAGAMWSELATLLLMAPAVVLGGALRLRSRP